MVQLRKESNTAKLLFSRQLPITSSRRRVGRGTSDDGMTNLADSQLPRDSYRSSPFGLFVYRPSFLPVVLHLRLAHLTRRACDGLCLSLILRLD